VGPPQLVLERLGRLALWALGLGAAGAATAGFGLFRLRRGRDFRRLPLVLPNLAALAVALLAAVAGAFAWLVSPSDPGWRFLRVPSVETAGSVDPLVRAIQRSTVAVFAPGEEGDARTLAVGTGAVVHAEAGRAWIVTCSHVAMPYEAVGAWRSARRAHPVWLIFADGRGALGRVRWTWRPPLDIVLLEAAITPPPPAVQVSENADALVPGSDVAFVPNPLRSGWKVHRGKVLARTLRRSPAGAYRLVHTTLPALPGDSGSGLFDAGGGLVGVNTWVRIESGATEAIALPAEAMHAIVREIREGRLDALDRVFPGGAGP
jgi:S1-C subfamily serine protease